jgi:hypothetical protein
MAGWCRWKWCLQRRLGDQMLLAASTTPIPGPSPVKGEGGNAWRCGTKRTQRIAARELPSPLAGEGWGWGAQGLPQQNSLPPARATRAGVRRSAAVPRNVPPHPLWGKGWGWGAGLAARANPHPQPFPRKGGRGQGTALRHEAHATNRGTRTPFPRKGGREQGTALACEAKDSNRATATPFRPGRAIRAIVRRSAAMPRNVPPHPLWGKGAKHSDCVSGDARKLRRFALASVRRGKR